MNVNHCHDIGNASDETLRFLSDLIEVSRSDEQLVYREAEIDELWRLLRHSNADAAAIATVMEVHDLLEDAGNAKMAAGKLRGLVREDHP
jgi:hypothetical protein